MHKYYIFVSDSVDTLWFLHRFQQRSEKTDISVDFTNDHPVLPAHFLVETELVTFFGVQDITEQVLGDESLFVVTKPFSEDDC